MPLLYVLNQPIKVRGVTPALPVLALRILTSPKYQPTLRTLHRVCRGSCPWPAHWRSAHTRHLLATVKDIRASLWEQVHHNNVPMCRLYMRAGAVHTHVYIHVHVHTRPCPCTHIHVIHVHVHVNTREYATMHTHVHVQTQHERFTCIRAKHTCTKIYQTLKIIK